LFKPYEPVAVLGCGKALVEFALVPEDSAWEVCGHADVECEASTGDYVGVVILFVHVDLRVSIAEIEGKGKCGSFDYAALRSG
jgi:hypothetical protein